MDEIKAVALSREIMGSTHVQDVWNILTGFLKEIGFKRSLYGYTFFRNENGFGDDADHFFLTNFSREYMDGYYTAQRYRHAPMIKWCLDNTGVCSWKWVNDTYDAFSSEEQKVIQFNQKLGVTAGYTISFRQTLRRSIAAIGISLEPGLGTQKDADAIWEKHGDLIEFICEISHLKISSLPMPRNPLTNRQREVLEWVADGKTVSETAQILNLTNATVEKHLRLARLSLNVETTAQAILKASFHNQIYAN